MINTEFCEKLFESMVNHELLNIYQKQGLIATLYSPSQTEEATLGYDALFNLFSSKGARCIAFQYKICCKYKRNPKKFRKRWSVYKFNVYKSKKRAYNQHNLLVDSHKKKISSLYCAPKFVSTSDLYKYSSTNQLLRNCIFITPKIKLGKKEKQHFYVYEKDRKKVEMHSSFPIQCESFGFENSDMNIDSIKSIFRMLNDDSFGRITKDEFIEFVNDNRKDLDGIFFLLVS